MEKTQINTETSSIIAILIASCDGDIETYKEVDTILNGKYLPLDDETLRKMQIILGEKIAEKTYSSIKNVLGFNQK